MSTGNKKPTKTYLYLKRKIIYENVSIRCDQRNMFKSKTKGTYCKTHIIRYRFGYSSTCKNMSKYQTDTKGLELNVRII